MVTIRLKSKKQNRSSLSSLIGQSPIWRKQMMWEQTDKQHLENQIDLFIHLEKIIPFCNVHDVMDIHHVIPGQKWHKRTLLFNWCFVGYEVLKGVQEGPGILHPTRLKTITIKWLLINNKVNTHVISNVDMQRPKLSCIRFSAPFNQKSSPKLEMTKDLMTRGRNRWCERYISNLEPWKDCFTNYFASNFFFFFGTKKACAISFLMMAVYPFGSCEERKIKKEKQEEEGGDDVACRPEFQSRSHELSPSWQSARCTCSHHAVLRAVQKSVPGGCAGKVVPDLRLSFTRFCNVESEMRRRIRQR